MKQSQSSRLPQIHRNNSEGQMNKMMKGSDMNSNNKGVKNSYPVRQLVSSVKSCINHLPNYGFSQNFQKQVQQDKRELEKLRLQDDSQNTRLLRIQQKERQVNDDYQKEKKKMEDTLEILAKQAEEFNEKQRVMNIDLEEKKKNIVIKQDNRREKELESKKRDEIENKRKTLEVDASKQKIKNLEEEYHKLLEQKKNLQQYEDFLNEVLILQKDESNQSNLNDDQDKNVNSIIDRFEQMRKEADKFSQQQTKTENEQDEVKKQILEIKAQLQTDILSHTHEMNNLKQDIDKLNQINSDLLVRVDSKFNDQRGKHLDFGQIFFGIQNLYTEYILKQKIRQEDHEEDKNNKDATQVILEKLEAIEKHLDKLTDIKNDYEARKSGKK